MTNEREEKVFDEKMSGKGVQADLSRSRKNGQTRPLSNETSEQREERLAAERKWATVKRSNETSEQREERLAAQRKRAAVKRCNESSKGREERLRAERERAAAKRAHETSQEKELRLRARRERAALKRQSETRWREWNPTDDPNPEGTPITADEIIGTPVCSPTNTCTTADGLTLKISVCITKSGLKKRWQPSIASRKTCATIIVSFANKHGHYTFLPDERTRILARGSSQTRSRVGYILPTTTWILVASQQNYKASVKSRNC